MSTIEPEKRSPEQPPIDFSDITEALRSPTLMSLIDLVVDDQGNQLFRGEDKSKMIIAQTVKRVMEEKGISLFELHERSQISTEDLQNLITRAKFDLRDSDPLVRLEQALGTKLRHL